MYAIFKILLLIGAIIFIIIELVGIFNKKKVKEEKYRVRYFVLLFILFSYLLYDYIRYAIE